MMDMSLLVQEVETFVQQYVSPEVLSQAGMAALLALIAGIAISVLGAKLARFVLTSACVVAGAALGLNVIARDTGFNPALCMVVAAALIGGAGYLCYRLWIGFAMAALLSAAALGTFSVERVLPYVAAVQSDPTLISAQVTPGVELTIPTLPDADTTSTASEALREYWTYAKVQDATLQPHARSLAVVASVAGLLIGMALVRFSTILFTSVVGTLLVGTGITGLISALQPGFYRTAVEHPAIGGATLGLCFLFSVILQTRLTRTPPPAPAKAAE